EDGIRDWSVTGVQTCALPIYETVSMGGVQRETLRSGQASGHTLTDVLRDHEVQAFRPGRAASTDGLRVGKRLGVPVEEHLGVLVTARHGVHPGEGDHGFLLRHTYLR